MDDDHGSYICHEYLLWSHKLKAIANEAAVKWTRPAVDFKLPLFLLPLLLLLQTKKINRQTGLTRVKIMLKFLQDCSKEVSKGFESSQKKKKQVET